MKKGIYKHFKGNNYELVSIVKHSETLEDMVVYKALYGEGGTWVRPASMWEEAVQHQGKTVKRFEYVGPVPVDNGFCPCPKKTCANNGHCQSCVVKHKNTDSLPVCLFPDNGGDKSLKHYYEILKARFEPK